MRKVGSEPYLECSSKGDKRFSAFYARILCEGGRSIEEIYQGVKVFDDGHGGFITNLDIKGAKGRLAVNQQQVAQLYSHLWNVYFQENPELLHVIRQYNGFSDIFGQPNRCCQAVEIYRIWQTFTHDSC